MRLLSIVVLLPLLLTACALSPQQVDLQPIIKPMPVSNIGHNQPLKVIGKDLRKTNVIGSRGSTYKDTSLIRASSKVAEPLAKLVRNNLQSRGFNTLNAGKNAPVLQIGLESLQYIPASGYVVNRVVVKTAIQAKLTQPDGNTLVRTYRSKVVHKQPLTPSADKNQKMLNDVLSRCIEQLLTDKTLLDQLVAAGSSEGADRPETSSTP